MDGVGGWTALIETQKLMYFLQLAGEPLNLDFKANRYGPYDNLRHVLAQIGGTMAEGRYGMELLATVHWIAKDAPAGTPDDVVARKVAEWSPRRARMFTPKHVDSALRSHSLLADVARSRRQRAANHSRIAAVS